MGTGFFVAIVSVFLQLLLSAFVIHQFQLENRTLFKIFLLVTAAFPINALLPPRYRLQFFVMISLAGIVMALGWRDGMMLIGAGLGLIAACHLPIKLWIRAVVVLVLGAGLALWRSGVVPSPIGAAVWPVLGSMFMFRLALYIHSLKHDQTPPNLTRTLAYFFMLPNVCYPLFPVVDYTTFGRTYYQGDVQEIYQRGAQWISRGLVHLLLYRFVYLHTTIGSAEVHDLGGVLRSILSVFFLYLRVSGQFHLIVGILHLFGFGLPETHRLYFLASSITDYWRRINIYWKDFMMKLAFYPSFFWLRKRGDRVALAGATMIVFLVTWILHSYQWFWLQSRFPITIQDILFWGILGGLVVVNSLREAKRGRKRTLGLQKKKWDPSLAVRTVSTFLGLCILWSLWSTESIVDWLWVWSSATTVTPMNLLALGALLALGLAVGGMVWDAPVVATGKPTPWYRRTETKTFATLGLLAVISLPATQREFGPKGQEILASIRANALNDADAEKQQMGYYENLDDQGRLSMQLWNATAPRPADWIPLARTKAYRQLADDFLEYDLVPSYQAKMWRQTVTINRWGMRDKEYPLEKPDSTHRIALLGPSFIMGTGLADDETLDAVLEEQLNVRSTDAKYEVLNFGVPAYSIVQQAVMLDEKVLAFKPDVVIITDNQGPTSPVVRHITATFARELPNPYPDLAKILERAGIEDFPGKGVPVPTRPLRRLAKTAGLEVRMPWREVDLRVRSVSDEIIRWAFRHIGERARANGIVPVFLALGLVSEPVIQDSRIFQMARDAGFIVLNLSDVYQGHPIDSMRIADWDDHPNAGAIRIVAQRVELELRRHEAALRLGLEPTLVSGQASTQQ